MKTKLMPLIMLLVLCVLTVVMPVHSFAASTRSAEPELIMEDVTIEDAQERVESKMYNIVEVVQVIGKPICIIGAIVGLLMAVFGALGKKGAMPGLIAFFISALCYVGVNYAQEIVLFIQAYVMS